MLLLSVSPYFQDQNNPSRDTMGALSKLISGGIGLADEYKASQKSKSPSSDPTAVDGYDSDRSADLDENSWQLDEVQQDKEPGDTALMGEDGVPTK